MLRVGAAGAACVLAGTVFAPSASAHDVLIGTVPKARSTVTAPRSTVTLTFNEPVQTSFAEVVVADSAGHRLSLGKPDVAGDTVTQRIKPFRATGGHRVSWRIVSDDGHPVSGTFTFTVNKGAVSTTLPTSSAPAGAGTTPAAAGPASDAQGQSFLQQHGVHMLIGLVIVVVGGGILIWERRRRSG